MKLTPFLIDEARTPLIISGPGQRSTDNYYKLAKIVPHLVRDEDYIIDEKQKNYCAYRFWYRKGRENAWR